MTCLAVCDCGWDPEAGCEARRAVQSDVVWRVVLLGMLRGIRLCLTSLDRYGFGNANVALAQIEDALVHG